MKEDITAQVNSRSVPLIAGVLGVGFISGLIPAGLLPANVLNIERAYGLSHGEMGRVVGLSMVLGGASGGLLGGWVCSRIGAIRTLLVSLIFTAASLACVGLIHSLFATVAGLAGYFFASGFLASSNALAAHMLQDRQRGVTLLHAMNGIGKLAGPILASLFLYGAWRYGFITAAVIPLILLMPLSHVFRQGGVNSIGRKREGIPHAGLFFWMAVAGFALVSGAEIAVALWTPAYAVKARGFSAAEGNLLLAIFSIGFVSGRFISSGLSSRFTSRQMIGICGSLLLAIIPALGFSSYPVVALFFLLLGAGFSSMWPSYFAHLSHVFPEHLGLMGGAAVFTTQIGFAACSWISGRLAEIGLAYALLFGTAVMAAFVLLFFMTPVGKSKAV